MELVSVNVGLPREVTYRGRSYPTAIFKDPVAGRVAVGRLNLDGDRQGNPQTHGGPDMAVYVYSRDHYPFWQEDLGTGGLPCGAFGENLTVTGMADGEVNIGDIYAIGSARFQVTEPRTPCHKLAMKFDDPGLPRRFFASGRLGFYFRVLTEGDVGAGDEIRCEARDAAGLTVAELAGLWADKGAGSAALERALAVEALSANWRKALSQRLAAAQEEPGAALREWREDRLTWV
ncbi:MAG: MOSC domain-containing protein [Alphaproteobacteria bacterium]|nr:MOSC domain-containing protein [Alphaproteobacteria bacterium]